MSIFNKILNLIRLFIISLKFNFDKTFNFKFKLLFLISLLASVLIRCNFITNDLVYNIIFNTNSIFLYLFLFGLIYLSLIYVTILLIRLFKRIFYSYKNIYLFIIHINKGTKDIKVIISFYYLQNLFFIFFSLFIIYNILNKLFYLLNQNINLFLFSLTSIIFMFILVYNLFLIIRDFKTIKLNLLSLNKINNKFLLFFLLLIIIINMCYIFIFPVFIFNLLNYDKLVSFIENFYIFKSNNIKLKPYYMFPKDNLDKGKAKELSNLNSDCNPNGFSKIIADYSDEDKVLFKDLFTTKESIATKAANKLNKANSDYPLNEINGIKKQNIDNITNFNNNWLNNENKSEAGSQSDILPSNESSNISPIVVNCINKNNNTILNNSYLSNNKLDSTLVNKVNDKQINNELLYPDRYQYNKKTKTGISLTLKPIVNNLNNHNSLINENDYDIKTIIKLAEENHSMLLKNSQKKTWINKLFSIFK